MIKLKHLLLTLAICGSGLTTRAQLNIVPGSDKLPMIEQIKVVGPTGKMKEVDSRYKSAINVMDKSKCVFKTGKDQQKVTEAYYKFLQGLGDFLKKNEFKWGQTVKCWNRVYFSKDGAVDYYFFDFRTDIPAAQIDRYKTLFRQYVASHKLGVEASEGFAQCSPVTFEDK